MSALPPKADICSANRNVRFGPKAPHGEMNYVRSPVRNCLTASGHVACGAFQIIGNEVTLIDRKTQQPLRDNQGGLYVKQLHDNDDPMREAKRLLKEYDAATSRKSDFNRQIIYSDIGIV
jgi:hypothetical protein